MSYDRPWKSFRQQLDLLKERGLVVTDEEAALRYLDRLGYYRLSAYLFPFRTYVLEQDSESGAITTRRLDEFVEGATFQSAVQLYVFDKRLRLLVLDAIERIEIAVRVDIAYLLGKKNTFAYADPTILDGKFTSDKLASSGKTRFQEWTEKYESALSRSRETFVRHYLSNHGPQLPIWVAIELWDFGLLSKFFSGMKRVDAREISGEYGIPNNRVFASWLRSMNYVRNICAHHGRLWNKRIVDQPRLPDRGSVPDLDYFAGKEDLIAKPFLSLCLLQFLMKQIYPASSWFERVKALLEDFPTNETENRATIADLGCIEGWESWDLWN